MKELHTLGRDKGRYRDGEPPRDEKCKKTTVTLKSNGQGKKNELSHPSGS